MKEVAFGVAKLAIKIGVGAAVSKVVGDVVKNNVNIDGVEDKILVTVGSFVIGAMVAEQATGFVSSSIDDVAEFLKLRKTVETTTLVVVEDLTP